MDSTNVTQREDLDIYCRTCYARNFGPKGYGVSRVSSVDLDEIPTFPKPAAPKLTKTPTAHEARKRLSFATGDSCFRLPSVVHYGGSQEKCRKCEKAVYESEKAIGGGGVYHKSCLRCEDCNRTLQTATVNEHNGIIFCKACYSRKYGPKGYGYGIGAGTLQTSAQDQNM